MAEVKHFSKLLGGESHAHLSEVLSDIVQPIRTPDNCSGVLVNGEIPYPVVGETLASPTPINHTYTPRDSKSTVNPAVEPEGLSQATKSHGYFRQSENPSVRVGVRAETSCSPSNSSPLQDTPKPESLHYRPITNVEYWLAEGTRLHKAAAELWVASWICEPEYRTEYELAATWVGERAQALHSIPEVRQLNRARIEQATSELYRLPRREN